MKFKSFFNQYIFILLTILVIGFSVFFVVRLTVPRYSVVYLQTGDIYFGKFRPFPFPAISGAWVLQRGTNGEVSLNPVSATIWKPVGEMFINPRQIVFWAKLDQQSAVMRAIKSGDTTKIPTLTPLPTPVPGE